MNHHDYYLNNKRYSNYLENQGKESFDKYLKHLVINSKRILDIGCGVGQVVNELSKLGKNAYGVDVSKSSIKIAKKKSKGKFYLIKHEELPFRNNFFDCVGSNNVLEHVNNPKKSILEMIRVLKKGGRIVISCPNFLSITNNYHPRVSGIKNKILNTYLIFSKLIKVFFKLYEPRFDKIEQIRIKPFKPDYDAINLVNPIDLSLFLKKNNIKITYMSGNSMENKKIIFNELPFFKLFFGSVFIVGCKV